MRLGEVKKASFLEVARHCELIFCLLTIPKFDLDEVEKAMIQVVEWPFEVIFCFLTKEIFFSSRYSYDSRGRMALKSHFLLLDKPKIRIC